VKARARRTLGPNLKRGGKKRNERPVVNLKKRKEDVRKREAEMTETVKEGRGRVGGLKKESIRKRGGRETPVRRWQGLKTAMGRGTGCHVIRKTEAGVGREGTKVEAKTKGGKKTIGVLAGRERGGGNAALAL
jgi:hypothetical protein